MLERYEAQKARIDRITGDMFPEHSVEYGNGLKPKSIDGIHVYHARLMKRICLLQGPFSVVRLEGLPDEELVKAFRESAKVHGYYLAQK